jgi:phosphate transport system permease protein
VAFNAKNTRLLVADRDGALRSYALHDEHPEAGFTALFGKVWYEGKDKPEYIWQSTGSADTEPKLSLIPLIFGTLKATLYAMLFSVPLALLAAIYTAEFMHPRLKAVIKPTVEIMAALPSVVLGFLGALVLAPWIEDQVPAFLCAVAAVPLAAMLAGWWWSGLPMRWRSLIKPGYEAVAVVPLLVLVAWGAWSLGPMVERWLFTVRLPSGAMQSDFRLWWAAMVGPFEQRNGLVVGLMMGFAVIPIIFTIAEDSLSNVPQALRSGSLALGASRWQTALRVVVPTASPGIFSALMIGLGRAIGETMIVVMAAGGTAILDLNIFNGMRTLSANIATEMPEAEQGSTHYRLLFLGALLLFALTFIINTAAEVVRSRLRERYKTV